MRRLIVAVACCTGIAGAQAHDSASAPADSGPRAPVRQVTPCVVVRIVDGDGVRCHNVGAVRLIGIDAPERGRPFADRASAMLASLVHVGDTVQLETDVSPRDRYRRVLAYVWRGGIQLNWFMVRLGYAVVYSVPPNVQFADSLVAAQQRARDEQRGLWKVDGFRCLPADQRRRACW